MTSLTRYEVNPNYSCSNCEAHYPWDRMEQDEQGEWVRFTEAERDKAEAVREMRRALIDLLHTPAVIDALNPSGQPHLGQCECPFCRGISAVGTALAARGAE